MSNHGSTSSTPSSPLYSTAEPRRMELSVNPEDGSLQTAPLSQVLLAATDALYSDLYNMAQGELDVVVTTTLSTALLPSGEEAEDEEAQSAAAIAAAAATVQRKRERMSNLSFAQRRHELAWRLTANGKSLQQVAALTAAAASSNDLGTSVQVSTKALQHTRTAWVQADEAQDALYFFHAQLFPARAAPHDLYGALDVLLHGTWYDLPRDLLLLNDRYETSIERTWSKTEVDQRWQLTVRDKLITGEVGWMRRNQLRQQPSLRPTTTTEPLSSSDFLPSTSIPPPPLWKVSLKGGIVKFTVGRPKTNAPTFSTDETATATTEQKYPIEALLTVLPSQQQQHSSVWTLLSVTVDVQAKTGECSHQLEVSNRQRFDLHRLAVTAMNREEVRSNQEHATAELSQLGSAVLSDVTACNDDNNNNITVERRTEPPLLPPPARPLHALFHVTHTFLLAWQLELLSAQAQALRRGVWSTAAADHHHHHPVVTPVRFFLEDGGGGHFGVMSISFWKVDDSYGPPTMGDLNLALLDDDDDDDKLPATGPGTVHSNTLGRSMTTAMTRTTSSQFTLSIRAESDTGIHVSLSGADHIMMMMKKVKGGGPRRKERIRSITRDLLEAASNPFALSASDALLAACKLCADFKCQAVVEALQPPPPPESVSGNGGDFKNSILPHWIRLSVGRGNIAVAANIRYHGIPHSKTAGMPILFEMVCDARTGSFVHIFPRSMKLLRRLAGNDNQASEAMSLRMASLPLNRRRAAGSNASARVVRDAFDSLIRSMNLLGERTGVGGTWDDVDEKSSSLRERAIFTACADVKSALIKCCGMTALYGLAPLALGVAVGLEALPDFNDMDRAGPAIEFIDGINLLGAPPVSILMGQELVETSVMKSDGVSVKTAYADQSLFSIACAVNENVLSLVPLEMNVKLESPTAFPERISCSLLVFKGKPSASVEANGEMNGHPPKRLKHSMNGDIGVTELESVMEEVSRLSELLSSTIDMELDDV